MTPLTIDMNRVSREEYWKYFQRLIFTADGGTGLTTLAWVLFWLDHIPDHFIHFHLFTGILFLTALLLGLSGAAVMIRTKNRLGSPPDRFLHLAQIIYTLISSTSGIYAYLIYPPV